MNLPPTILYVFNPDGKGIGIGGELPGNKAHLLEKDSWSAAVVDELVNCRKISRSTNIGSAVSGTRLSTASCAISR